MAQTPVITLDLNFQRHPHVIASYLIRHSDGAVLIESGPGSTLAGLEAGLAKEGLSARDVTHVLLTHIHLDHAGAAGWLARQGAEIIVHPLGAPHMINPEKLLASATRLYGETMKALWGECLSVPEDKIKTPSDGEEIRIGNLTFVPINTPGHAVHHYAYRFENTCFSGDIGGVRMPGYQHLRVPMVPPELHLERWHNSMMRLRKEKFSAIAPTHFGMFNDVTWHLNAVDEGLNSASRWLEEIMHSPPSPEQMRQSYADWIMKEGKQIGLDEAVVRAYELANPLDMSADGLLRYWKKVRNAVQNS